MDIPIKYKSKQTFNKNIQLNFRANRCHIIEGPKIKQNVSEYFILPTKTNFRGIKCL